jgi:hypothetical protein
MGTVTKRQLMSFKIANLRIPDAKICLRYGIRCRGSADVPVARFLQLDRLPVQPRNYDTTWQGAELRSRSKETGFAHPCQVLGLSQTQNRCASCMSPILESSIAHASYLLGQDASMQRTFQNFVSVHCVLGVKFH